MKLFFVADSRDIHAKRFSRIFESLHEQYEFINFERFETSSSSAVSNDPGLGALLEEMQAEPSLVVSGPLDGASRYLAGGKFVHVGISWATDMMVWAPRNQSNLAEMRAIALSLDLIFTDNYATENAFLSLGVKPEKIVRFPWGPESPTLKSRTHSIKKKDLGIAPDAPVLLYPRKLDPHYEPHVFINALRIAANLRPDLIAILIEAGSQVAPVKQRISDLGLERSVRWVSPQPSPGMNDLVGLSDALIVSPLTDGTSVTVLEAMQSGTPVITSLNPGSSEWIINGITGWNFPTGNPVALAEAISGFLECSDSHRQQIVSNAQRLVEHRAGWSHAEEIIKREILRLLIDE